MARSGVLLPLLLVLLPSSLAGPARAPVPQVQSARWLQSGLADWLPGGFTHTYVEGSSLRLQPGQRRGEYLSPRYLAAFAFNGAVVDVVVHATGSQSVTLQLRSSPDGQHWEAWIDVLHATNVPGRAGSRYLALKPGSLWLQYRANFAATSDTPRLDEIGVTYLDSAAGTAPEARAGRPLVGPATRTPVPLAIPRDAWSPRQVSGFTERQQQHRIEIHQIQVPAMDPDTAATLRALQWVATTRDGADDLPFHYLLDGRGTIYEAQSGVTVRDGGTSDGTVQIALLVDVESDGMPDAVKTELPALLAWLAEAYRIPMSNINVARDAPPKLSAMQVELRANADRATVRWRRFFPEGSPANGSEHVLLFNGGDRVAHAVVTGYADAILHRRGLTVAPMQRVDVAVEGEFGHVPAVGVEVVADQPLVAERTQSVRSEFEISTGVADPARSWYFAGADTTGGSNTYLLVINPQQTPAEAHLTVYPESGVPLSRTLTFPATARSTVLLNDLAPNQRGALKLVATSPIVVEQAFFATSGAASLAPGTTELSRHWLFGEGMTTTGYTTTLHLFNPWSQPVGVVVQVLSEDGTSVSRHYALGSTSALSLPMNAIAPDLPFALDIQSERQIAVEREMQFAGGHAATFGFGATAPQTRWSFVEEAKEPAGEQWLSVANPNRGRVALDVVYTLVDGTVQHHRRTMPGTARLSLAVRPDQPGQQVVAITITADRPVVVERSIFTRSAAGSGGETTLGSGGP